MSPKRFAAIFQHNTRVLVADPGPIIVTTLMPLVLMIFLQGMGRTVLESEGFAGASGAEHVVPGMAVLFSLFGVIHLGMSFFQEHGWGTWDRLRASPASPIEILLGKMLPPASIILIQSVVLFAAGALLFDLDIRGSVVALGAMVLATTVFLIALSMLAVALFTTISQLSAATNVLAMILGGLGGALAPLSVLPDWAQTIAPISPAYWSLMGLRAVLLEGGGMQAVLVPVGILLGASLVVAALAASRFRFTDEKAWV